MAVTYTDFREKVIDNLEKMVSVDSVLKGAEVKLFKMDVGITEDGNLDSIGILVKDGGYSYSPTVPLFPYYKDFVDNNLSIDEITQNILEAYNQVNSIVAEDSKKFIAGLDSAVPVNMTNVFCEVVPQSRIENIKDKIPHKDYHDMSIVYRVMLEKGKDGTLRSMSITNGLLKKMGINEEMLDRLAVFNTKKILPATIKDLNQAVFDFYASDEIVDFEAAPFGEGLDEESELYILSNTYEQYGSIYMLDENIMGGLAEFFDDDIVVLPASVNDVQLSPYHRIITDELSIDSLKSIVAFENKKIPARERLSKNAYVWSKDRNRLEELNQSFVPTKTNSEIVTKRRKHKER